MKKLLAILLWFLPLLTLHGQETGLGIGMIIGEPTGLSAKMWMNEKNALDAGIAWSFAGTGYLRVHSDILWHSYPLNVEKGKLPVYYGVGAKLLLSSELGLGIRVPVGLAYLFESAPVDLFAELVPGLDLLPGTGLGIDAAIGVRYFF
jgi:hypothetical protein